MKKAKRLQKARQNPKGVTFEELVQILDDHGFTINRTNGSHYLFERITDGIPLTYAIPRHKSVVKAVYVKKVLEFIDRYDLKFTEDNHD
jgi:predicted RNA binding protein YcfA (HicA-like mRNA interferase family)